MIDDHDRCEWVNVSSDTSSPGLSDKIQSHKTVVCVCVCRSGADRAVYEVWM